MEIPSSDWGFYGVWSYGYPFEGPLYLVVHEHLRISGPFRIGCSHAYMLSRIVENWLLTRVYAFQDHLELVVHTHLRVSERYGISCCYAGCFRNGVMGIW